MEHKKFGENYVVRLDKGDEIIESLLAFAEECGVKLGSISAIGALSSATVGAFDTVAKEYRKEELNGDYEIISLCGNFTSKDGKHYLHAHICVSGEDCAAKSGHLFRGIISLTCEVFVTVFHGEACRRYDENVGINRISLD